MASKRTFHLRYKARNGPKAVRETDGKLYWIHPDNESNKYLVTEENFADAMTKILERIKLLSLVGRFYGVQVAQNDHGSLRKIEAGLMLVRHGAGWGLPGGGVAGSHRTTSASWGLDTGRRRVQNAVDRRQNASDPLRKLARDNEFLRLQVAEYRPVHGEV